MIITCSGFKGGVTKTTTVVHLACYFSQKGRTLFVDGAPNRFATRWGTRGKLPFRGVDLMAAVPHAPGFELIFIWPPSRVDNDELEALVDGCDVLMLLASPDALSVDAMPQTIHLLQTIGLDRFNVFDDDGSFQTRKDGQSGKGGADGLTPV